MALQNERLLEDLRERQARLSQLLDISHELLRAHVGEETLLARIAQRGAELLGADVAGVLLVDDGVLTVRGAFGDAVGLFGDPAPREARARLADALRQSDALTVPGVGWGRVGMVVPLRASSATELGRRARQRCAERYSFAAARALLFPLIDDLSARFAAPRQARRPR
jgi:hypothetical protein